MIRERKSVKESYVIKLEEKLTSFSETTPSTQNTQRKSSNLNIINIIV